MDSTILREIISNHNNAELLISIFLIVVDIILFLIYLLLFNNVSIYKFPHKKNLSYIYFYDIIIRIAKIYISTFIFSLPKEIFMNTLVSLQFFLIIYSFNAIFTDKLNENCIENDLKIKYPILITVLFFVFTFKNEYPNIVALAQYVSAIIAIFFLGSYVQKKIRLFFTNITKQNPYYKESCYINLLYLIPIYFYAFYIIKIVTLVSKKMLYFSYMEMIGDTFMEAGKYLIIILLMVVYYIFNKYLNVDKTQFESTNKNNVTIYKDDEELVGSKK